MKRPGALTAAPLAILLLLNAPALASASLTNTAMLALRTA